MAVSRTQNKKKGIDTVSVNCMMHVEAAVIKPSNCAYNVIAKGMNNI